MKFRGSSYMPADVPRGSPNRIRFEAHRADQGYVIARLGGDPEKIARPGLLAAWFGQSARQTTVPQTIPAAAAVVGEVANARAALTAIFLLEAEMLVHFRLADIGNAPFKKIKHYTELIEARRLPAAPVPLKLIEAADRFVGLVGMDCLFTIAPLVSLGASWKAFERYRKLPVALTR